MINQWYLRMVIVFLIATLWLIGIGNVSAQQPEQILRPPYYGETAVNAVFDHEFPVYCEDFPDRCAEIDYLRRFPNCTVSDANTVGTQVLHYNGTHSTILAYSGHNGVDFDLNYQYVLATHNGVVAEAGWDAPENRRLRLGLRIILRTNDNRYQTEYGHMSALMVQQGDSVSQEDVIGISGNTGFSTGPHLHFAVRRNGVVVNPYGWQQTGGREIRDPWHCVNPAVGSQLLWEILPNISNNVYPDGPGLELPPDPPRLQPDWTNPVRQVIDDQDGRFLLSGSGWNFNPCDPDSDICYAVSYWWKRGGDGDPNAYANWRLFVHDLVIGRYDIYAYIPAAHANSVAHYRIFHNDKEHSASIEQSRFNQPGFPHVWAYLGRYDFSDGTNLTQPQRIMAYHDGNSEQPIAVDAVVLVLADGPPDLNVGIVQRSDDAGPDMGCSFWTERPEIYLGHCNNGNGIVSGFRYSGVNIPANATITRAHLMFTVDGDYSNPYTQVMRLRFYGDSTPLSPTFSVGDKPEDRPLTNAWVFWSVPETDSWRLGQKRYSPNLAPVVQELIGANWQPNVSAITFIMQPAPGFTGNQHRRVLAYDRPPLGQRAARLLVWYTTGNP
jgi:hypothetical protein